MGTRLLVHAWGRHNQPEFVHPALSKLWQHARESCDHAQGYSDRFNSILNSHSVRTRVNHKSRKVWFEFESDEQLTSFLLTWS